MNITAAFNKTSIVWQDVFNYHKQVSSPVSCFLLCHANYFDLLLTNTHSLYVMSIYVHRICSRVELSMWWRCGKGNATCVRCGRWLRLGWESSWQHHFTWTCLDPHTTGLATTLCARSPLGVRCYVHSELSGVLCDGLQWNGFHLLFKRVLSLSQSLPSSRPIKLRKSIINCEKERKFLGNRQCVVKVASFVNICVYQ